MKKSQREISVVALAILTTTGCGKDEISQRILDENLSSYSCFNIRPLCVVIIMKSQRVLDGG